LIKNNSSKEFLPSFTGIKKGVFFKLVSIYSEIFFKVSIVNWSIYEVQKTMIDNLKKTGMEIIFNRLENYFKLYYHNPGV